MSNPKSPDLVPVLSPGFFSQANLVSVSISGTNLSQQLLEPKKMGENSQGLRFSVAICAIGWINSHYLHIVGDGHQPNSRGLYTHYKDSY